MRRKQRTSLPVISAVALAYLSWYPVSDLDTRTNIKTLYVGTDFWVNGIHFRSHAVWELYHSIVSDSKGRCATIILILILVLAAKTIPKINVALKRECAPSIGYLTGTNILLFQPRYSSMSSTRPTLWFRHIIFLVYVRHFLRNSVLMTYIVNVI